MTNLLPPTALNVVRDFVIDMGERAGSTFCQTLASFAVGAGMLDVLHFDWRTALSVSAGAAILSVLKSVGAGAVAKTGTASLTPAVVPRAAVSAAVLGYGDHAATMKG